MFFEHRNIEKNHLKNYSSFCIQLFNFREELGHQSILGCPFLFLWYNNFCEVSIELGIKNLVSYLS